MTAWIQEGRPSIHFAPQRGWINDPNGLVYDGTRYHLFAQHNPADTVWGPMHWLHAVSCDLLSWRELGIALYPNALGTMFSGSAVIDAQNTAGFGPGAMVAMFTQDGRTQTQGLAYSLDGERFTVYSDNPVIPNPGIRDFRDPKVFWHAQTRSWRMVLAAGQCMEFYRSDDLIKWHKTGEFGAKEKGEAGIYECPDLIALPAPGGQDLWVLMASIGARPQDGGERVQYFLGEYDGETFRQTEAIGRTLRVDAGPDHYAATTYSGTAERVLMGWAAAPVYAGKVPAGGYRGCLTLPRTLRLAQTQDGPRLASAPVLPPLCPRPLNHEGTLPTGAYVLRIRATGAFELGLCNGEGDAFTVGLDASGRIVTDRTGSGLSNFSEWFASRHYSVTQTPRLLSGPLEMTLIIDHTLMELFADEGTYAQTSLLFPRTPYSHLRMHGAVEVLCASV